MGTGSGNSSDDVIVCGNYPTGIIPTNDNYSYRLNDLSTMHMRHPSRAIATTPPSSSTDTIATKLVV